MLKKLYEESGFVCESEDFILAQKDIEDLGSGLIQTLSKEQREQYLKIIRAYEDARETEKEELFKYAYKMGSRNTAETLIA